MHRVKGDAKKRKVQVWVQSQEGKFLVLKTNATRGSFWQPITGSVEPGESLQSAALREFHEETGLEANQADCHAVGFEFEYNGIHETVFSIQLSLPSKGLLVKIDPKEHTDWAWMEAEEALAIIRFDSNKEALKKIIGTTS